MARFRDRQKAGQQLAEALDKYKDEPTVIYALPRGGVVLGVEITQRLGAGLDLAIPRKIGHPRNPEYAVCAVTEDGFLVCNEDELARLSPDWFEVERQRQQTEATRRREVYLAGRPPVSAKGKTAIIVDDGIATGLTMQAAIQEVKSRGADKIVVA